MEAENQNPQTQNSSSGQQWSDKTSGDDWQRQAVEAAQAGAHQAQATQATNSANPGVPGVPDWQQGFMRQGSKPDPMADVPDMLAPADPKAPQGPEPQDMLAAADSSNQPSQSSATPHLGASTGPGVVMGSFGDDIPAAPVVGTGGASLGKKVVALLILFVILGAAAAGYFFLLR